MVERKFGCMAGDEVMTLDGIVYRIDRYMKRDIRWRIEASAAVYTG